MPGSHSALLSAFVIPAIPAPFFDHTYAISSCGFEWGYFGGADSSNVSGSRNSLMDDMSNYKSFARVLANTGTDIALFQEMQAFFVSRLGRPITDLESSLLFKAQMELWAKEDDLSHRLDVKIITREEYFQLSDNFVRASMQLQRDILGDRDFHLVYGEAGDHPEGLVDRDLFARNNCPETSYER